MYFFDKYKAMKIAKKIFSEELELGVPKVVTKKNHKYKKFDKPVYASKFSWLTYNVYDEEVFSFKVQYNKNKSMSFDIRAERLNLTYSQNGMKMIREQYKHYQFNFNLGNTHMNVFRSYINTLKDFEYALRDEIKRWNNSGLYNLLLELYKVK